MTHRSVFKGPAQAMYRTLCLIKLICIRISTSVEMSGSQVAIGDQIFGNFFHLATRYLAKVTLVAAEKILKTIK